MLPKPFTTVWHTQALQNRQAALDDAYNAHPERFVKKPPRVIPLPEAAWINKPVDPDSALEEIH